MSETVNLQSQFYIQIDGSDAPVDMLRDLEQLSVESSLHLPSVAELHLYDPDLVWIDHSLLSPGKPLTITAKVGSNQAKIFDGEIVELEPTFDVGAPRLLVRAFDRLHRLARGRHVKSFINVKDSDIVSKVASQAGLTADTQSTSQVHPYVLQNNETNLAFLQRRAAMLGRLLYVEGSKLHCEPPPSNPQEIELGWGSSLYEFRPRMTTVDQVNEVTVRGWDPNSKQAVVGKASGPTVAPKVGLGRDGGVVAKQAFNVDAPYLVAHQPIRTQAVAEVLAKATVEDHGGRFIEAEGVCTGWPKLNAGVAVKVAGVGQRFGGIYFVTSATHLFDVDEGYRTLFNASALQPATLLSLLVPREARDHTAGLVIGIVTDNKDPDDQGRVKVKFPWLDEENASDWVRVLSVGGGPNCGIEFLPAVNDEVLVGFELGDIQQPYVLGGLWNGRDAPPKPNSEVTKNGKVQQQVIRSRTGHLVILDDDTAGGGITIKDKAGNSVTLDTKGKSVTIESQGALSITSKSDLSLKAQGKLVLEAQGSSELKGMGVKIEGGAGNVDVKGLTINLN